MLNEHQLSIELSIHSFQILIYFVAFDFTESCGRKEAVFFFLFILKKK